MLQTPPDTFVCKFVVDPTVTTDAGVNETVLDDVIVNEYVEVDVEHTPLPVYVTTTVPDVPVVVNNPVVGLMLAKVLGLTLHVPPSNVELNPTVELVHVTPEVLVLVMMFVHEVGFVVTVITLVLLVAHPSVNV